MAGETRMIRDQDSTIAGNVYDKYRARNPLVRLMMAAFLAAFDELIGPLVVGNSLEVGCGEGQLTKRLKTMRGGMAVSGIDISEKMVRLAKELNNGGSFAVASVERLPFSDDAFDLVIGCEVLEHVTNYNDALEEMSRVAGRYCLFSVPWEPIWRLLNLLRGKYLRHLGNTPGHIQHWSRREFIAVLKAEFRILEIKTPFPWTMALCEPRARG